MDDETRLFIQALAAAGAVGYHLKQLYEAPNRLASAAHRGKGTTVYHDVEYAHVDFNDAAIIFAAACQEVVRVLRRQMVPGKMYGPESGSYRFALEGNVIARHDQTTRRSGQREHGVGARYGASLEDYTHPSHEPGSIEWFVLMSRIPEILDEIQADKTEAAAT